MLPQTLTNIGTYLRLRKERDKGRQDGSPGAGSLLADTPLGHMHVDITISQELLVRRRRYPQFVRVGFDPT